LAASGAGHDATIGKSARRRKDGAAVLLAGAGHRPYRGLAMRSSLLSLVFLSLVACGPKPADSPAPAPQPAPVADPSPAPVPAPVGDGACSVDADCVPAGCCHPTTCVPTTQKPDCADTMCTMNCAPGTLDCGQGRCACEAGSCKPVFSQTQP